MHLCNAEETRFIWSGIDVFTYRLMQDMNAFSMQL